MDDAAIPAGDIGGAGSQASQLAQGDGGRVALGQGGIGEEIHIAAKELELVDGLVGATAAQFMRTVRAEQDQWQAGLARLDDGGEIIGGRRARCADQGGRLSAAQRQAKREESGAAFVEVGADVDMLAMPR